MIPIAKPILGKEELEAVKEVFESGNLAQGPKVEEFEKQFAKYIGTKYAVAVANGTTALALAIKAAEIDGEVITSPFSFIASANSILFAGAKPVFADINPRTFNIDPEKIREKVTKKTEAIMPVHLYGQPCAMDEIMEIAEENNLILIEDVCQAHDAEYKNRKVGSFGIGCFSFYPTKNMTCGEGGMIITNDEQIAEAARVLRNHGQKERYFSNLMSCNLRMTDMEAAIGLVQLKKLDEFNHRRIKNAEYLSKNLAGVEVPYVSPGVKHVFHQYTIKSKNRDALQKHLEKCGIQSIVYYPYSIPAQPVYQKLGYSDRCSITEGITKQVLSLPVHPALTKEDLEKIVSSVNAAP